MTKEELNASKLKSQELRDSDDVDIIGIIDGRVATLKGDGHPTRTVVVPTQKCNAIIFDIKELEEKLEPSNFDFSDDATKLKLEEIKANIELLQNELKIKSYQFVLRGFATKVYQELLDASQKAQNALKDGEELPTKDSYTVKLISASIDSYTLDNQFVDFKELDQNKKLEFVDALDKVIQLPLLEKVCSKLFITADDFEKAMRDVIF